jgi:hypothetical protein
MTAIDPQDHSRLDTFLQALGAPLKMGVDAQNMANALIPTMQSLVQDRPDLANAQFDFQSNNGAIKVVSNTMSESDRTWLEGQLNGNSALVQAVQSFHDDAVAGYANFAEANGTPLTPSQSDTVSKQADGLTSFMDLFKKLGADGQACMFRDGPYYTPDGAKMTLAQDPGSAVGFLSFMKSVQAAANGTSHYVSPTGKTLYGILKLNVFELGSSAIPQFFPPSQTQSMGVHETA